MDELLASEKRKRSLTDFLIKNVVEHLKLQGVHFVLAGNMETISSFNGEITISKNNHEEADSLLVHAMTLVKSLIETQQCMFIHLILTCFLYC